MNEEVLDLIMVELELQGLNDEIYRYLLNSVELTGQLG